MASKYDKHTTGSQLVKELEANIKGKVILVTGVTPGGIGAWFSIAVAKASPRLIILAGRKPAAAQKTTEDIAAVNSAVATKTLNIDLASLDSVRTAASEVLTWSDVPHIDVLVNNAAIMAVPYKKTVDGFESQFGTNHLGHFLFTNLIMGKILASKTPRIVSVSSNGHRLNPIRWTDINYGDGKYYNKWAAYGQSKTANNLMAVQLAAKLQNRGLQAFSLHPGVFMDSALGASVDWNVDFDSLKAADAMMGTCYISKEFENKTADEIIATHVYAAFTDDLKDNNGVYLDNCNIADQYKEEVWPWGKDPIDADRLWTLSETLVGQKFQY
ncbi:short-chain dehydrogenase/ reductase [Hypoxylon sp. FL1284]|nr:short-chain dehydrogenase/ reductase [Hypoxylon sp. FL1284]